MLGTATLVLGDVMLDRHLHGHVRRISPEAPVPVVGLFREDCTPGGAGHVAASLAGLGCPVTLVGLVGKDLEGEQLRGALETKGVARLVLAERPELATICKTRVLSDSHQQLLRLDRDGNREAYSAAAGAVLDRALPLIAENRAVVLADYDKGTITPDMARAVIRRSRERGVPCVVDPKKTDLSTYAGATVLAPNVFEVERALGRTLDSSEAIGRAAEELRVSLGLDSMLITRGADGMTLATQGGIVHVPARTREVADVTGAGDTVVAVLAACLGSSWEIEEACQLASVAAGIAVGRAGTYVVQAAEVEAAWRGGSPKVLDWAAARRRIAEARRAGRRVVFTNGCFDILHAGHLSCLERARELGDLLVVALNSDASVRLNKGASRPIIGQDDRAALLAGLACVDVVVTFDEVTPELLIRHLEPDVLVKGSDYAVSEIAGAEFVESRGGRVVTLPLVPGLSTTGILARGSQR
jgi:D-beta-D-heptose 7-phosphate kinase/D-beta-D-heptose 1-phosphate adenosyltransferase